MYFDIVGEIVRPSRNAAGAERRSFAFPFLLRRALEPVQLGGVVDEDPAANGCVGRPLEQEVEQVGVVREGVPGRGWVRPVARPQDSLWLGLHQGLCEWAAVSLFRWV